MSRTAVLNGLGEREPSLALTGSLPERAFPHQAVAAAGVLVQRPSGEVCRRVILGAASQFDALRHEQGARLVTNDVV